MGKEEYISSREDEGGVVTLGHPAVKGLVVHGNDEGLRGVISTLAPHDLAQPATGARGIFR